MGYRVEHQPSAPAHELPIHLRERYQEFIDEYYDVYYALPKMSTYYKNGTFKDLLGWTNKLEVKKALADHAATHLGITPYEIDYLANLLEPLCTSYTFESLKMLLLPLDRRSIVG